MKVRILTFHRAHNYGAFLQCYALKTYLEQSGHSVDVLDYWPDGHNNAYKIFDSYRFRKASFLQKIKILISFIFSFRRKSIRAAKTKKIQKDFLKLSDNPKYRTGMDLSDIEYDLLIYGSDQIWWNSTLPGYKGYDWAYWGDFVPENTKKISYAASMGIIDLTDEDKTEIAGHLLNFEKVSVRESTLKTALECFVDTPVSLVCDPVFLLDKESWLNASRSYTLPDRYVLLFNLMHSPDAKIVAETVSRKLSCPVVEVTSMVMPWRFGRYLIQKADAFEFINIISNATFVVTSSFHGTAFSVIFEKQFLALGMKKNSGRVASLLSKLELSDRLIQGTEDYVNFAPINYSQVEPLLNTYIKQSQDYLCEI